MAPQAPLLHRSQEEILYRQGWDSVSDGFFVSKLADIAMELKTVLTRSTAKAAIQAAQLELNILCDKDFKLWECARRFRHLQHRYNVFNFLLSVRSVFYDAEANVVHVEEDFIWNFLCSRYRLAEAYMYRGEHEWHALCIIFGPPHTVPLFNEDEVIDLTSEPELVEPFIVAVEEDPIAEPVVEAANGIMILPREAYRNVNADHFSNGWWDDVQGVEGGDVSLSSVNQGEVRVADDAYPSESGQNMIEEAVRELTERHRVNGGGVRAAGNSICTAGSATR